MLNFDSRSKSKLLWIGTLLAPVVAVQGLRLLVGGSTSKASAATTPAPAAPPGLVGPMPEASKLSPAQTKAVNWLLSRKQVLGVRSPMDYPDTDVPHPAMQTQTISAPVTAQPAVRPPATMTINALLSGGRVDNTIVSINHKLYHVGDEIVPRWTIHAIDGRNRTVTIDGPEGQSITLKLTIADN
jgi:hypothetical protein